MAAKFDIDVHGWRKQVERIASAYGIEMNFLLAEMHRLFTRDVQMKLPTATKGGGRLMSGTAFSDFIPTTRTMVENKKGGPIESDLRRIFVPVTASMEKTEEIRNLKSAGSVPFRRFEDKSGAVWGVDSNLWSTSRAAVHAHHQKFRTKAGRVTRAGDYDRRIGRWKFIDKMHIPVELFRSYLAEVKRDIGKTQAGFNSAMAYFSGLVGAPATLPTYAKRHGSGQGTFADSFNKQTGDGSMVSINSIPWVWRFRGMADAAARTREKDLHAGWFEKRMPRLIKRWDAISA